MIKFFRKIRQKLLAENKFSKYIIYAIGEIVLVVIGILIALQVNNWSTNNKEKELETKILTEISVALQSDLKDLEFNLTEHEQIFQSQKYMIDWLQTDEPYTDSLSVHMFNVVNGTTFLSNNGSYETLKGLGIHLISNDSLRMQILNLYELRYKDYQATLKQINDYRFDLISRDNAKYFQVTSPYFPMQPLDAERIKSENGYAYHLKTLASYNKYFVEQKVFPTKVAIEETLELIDCELKK
ncbi:MAG: DUF6090 family protein [Bacteroidota bacterium]